MDTLRDCVSLKLQAYLQKYNIPDDPNYKKIENEMSIKWQQIDKTNKQINQTTRVMVMFYIIRCILMAAIPFEMLIVQLYYDGENIGVVINYICAAFVQIVCYNTLIIFSTKYEQVYTLQIQSMEQKIYLFIFVLIQIVLFAFPIMTNYTQSKIDMFAIWSFIWGVAAGIDSDFDCIWSHLDKVNQQHQQALAKQVQCCGVANTNKTKIYEKTKQQHDILLWLFCNQQIQQQPTKIDIYNTLFEKNVDFISLMQKQRLVGYNHNGPHQEQQYNALIKMGIFKINDHYYNICKDQRDDIDVDFWKALEQLKKDKLSPSVPIIERQYTFGSRDAYDYNQQQFESFQLLCSGVYGLRLKQQVQECIKLYVNYMLQGSCINIQYQTLNNQGSPQQYNQQQKDQFVNKCRQQIHMLDEKQKQLTGAISKRFDDWRQFENYIHDMGWVDKYNPCQDRQLQKLWRIGQSCSNEASEYQQKCINKVISRIKLLSQQETYQCQYPPEISQLKYQICGYA